MVSEVDRYDLPPAASYKLGELKIKELRRRAEQALGDKFDLREFHVVVLEGGSLPLSALMRLTAGSRTSNRPVSSDGEACHNQEIR